MQAGGRRATEEVNLGIGEQMLRQSPSDIAKEQMYGKYTLYTKARRFSVRVSIIDCILCTLEAIVYSMHSTDTRNLHASRL